MTGESIAYAIGYIVGSAGILALVLYLVIRKYTRARTAGKAVDDYFAHARKERSEERQVVASTDRVNASKRSVGLSVQGSNEGELPPDLRQPATNRNLLVGLTTACIILALVSTFLAVALYKKPRFAPLNSQSPYVMFDNKTAQACWSGPLVQDNSDPWAKYRVGGQIMKAPIDLPVCKDLK